MTGFTMLCCQCGETQEVDSRDRETVAEFVEAHDGNVKGFPTWWLDRKASQVLADAVAVLA